MSLYGADPIAFESVSAVTATPSVDLGTRRVYNGEEYVYCYNATGSQATAGALMIASGGSGYSLTRSSTARADFPVCAVKHAAVDDGSYFWGLVRGVVDVMSATNAKGEVLTVGADGAVGTYLVGSFPTCVIIGKAMEAGSGSTAFAVQVRLFG